MKQVVVRFLLLVVAVTIASSFVWLYLIQNGLQKTPMALDHPFLKGGQNQEWIAFRGLSRDFPENSMPAFSAAVQAFEKAILWVDVQATADGQVVALAQPQTAATTGHQGLIGLMDWTEVQKLDAGYSFRDAKGDYPFRDKGIKVPRLQDLLAQFPNQRFVVHVVDYRPGLDKRLAEVIESGHAADRVLLHSENDGILRDLREQHPVWLFGTSQTQLTQLLSLKLGPVAPLRGDVMIAPPFWNRTPFLTEAMCAEAHRRHLKVFAGPLLTEADSEASQSLPIDGFISDHLQRSK